MAVRIISRNRKRRCWDVMAGCYIPPHPRTTVASPSTALLHTDSSEPSRAGCSLSASVHMRTLPPELFPRLLLLFCNIAVWKPYVTGYILRRSSTEHEIINKTNIEPFKFKFASDTETTSNNGYIVTWLSVTRDEVWIGNWIYWTFSFGTDINYDSLSELLTPKITVTTEHRKPPQSSLAVAW